MPPADRVDGRAQQRRTAWATCVFRLHHPRIPDPAHRTGALSAIYLARRLISYEYGKRLAGDGPGAPATGCATPATC